MNVKRINNLFLIVAISLVESLSLLIVMALVSSGWPYQLSSFTNDLYPYFRLDIHPEREMLLYRLNVISAIVIGSVLITVFKEKLDDEQITKSLTHWLLVMLGGLGLQLFWAFKVCVAGPNGFGLTWLIVTTVLIYLVKIFYCECCRLLSVAHKILVIQCGRLFCHPLDIITPLIIVAIFWITDLKQVLALIFATDQFYHLDGFIMSAVWGLHQGLTLNTDVISQYSVLMPKIMHQLLMWMGAVSYGNLIVVMMGLTICYWLVGYVLLRLVVKDQLIATAAVLLAVKWQTFHEGVIPIIWRYGTPTVLRFLFDASVLILLLLHSRDQRRRWLWLAGGLCGFSVAWMIDTGTYLMAALIVYLLCLCYSDRSKILSASGVVGLAVLVGFLSFGAAVGGQVVESSFWQRMFEHAALFLSAGFGSLPITEGLTEQRFFCFFKGLIIPLVYVAVLLWQLMRLIDDKHNARARWMIALCCYGLGLYHYFINRSAFTSFDVVCFPVVIILACGLKYLKDHHVFQWNVTQWLFLLLIFGALMTTRLMAFYPNIFYQSNTQLQAVKSFYENQYDLSDATLIASLTESNERVAVISSFEIGLLMAANRTSYFYYTPMIESTLWTNEAFRGTYLHHQQRLTKIVDQWHQQPPKTVVIQTSLIKGPKAPYYWQTHPTLKALIDLMGQGYQEVKQGRWVTVFQAR